MLLRQRVSILFFGCFLSITALMVYYTYLSPVNRARVLIEEQASIMKTRTARGSSTKWRAKGFCSLPVLDPYNADVMKYVEKLDTPICEGTSYGHLNGNDLVVRGTGILDVTMRIIRRVSENDFEVDTSKTIGIFEHPQIMLTKGTFGCLAVSLTFGLIAVPEEDDDFPAIAALKHQDCTYEGIFEFSKKGYIRHLASNRCLFVEGKKIVFKKCKKKRGWAKFDFDEDGRIWYKDSTFFGLWSKTYCLTAKKSKGKRRLGLGKKCLKSNELNLFSILEAKVKDVDVKVKVDEEAFQLYILKEDKVHREFHLHSPRISKQFAERKLPQAIPLNIILLMFDSQSSANFDRAMPKTLKMLGSLKHSFNFRGHAIVGDGTTAQLCAMLTGVAEEELPEARRDMENSDHVDRWPFIFKQLSENGYVTMFTDDQPSTASFNMRLHGFKNQPTDHYGRPFWMVAEASHTSTYCINDKFSHQYNFDYLKSFTRNYADKKKFSLVITSDLCHNSANTIQFVDKDLAELIRFLKDDNHLNNSMLVIFGDHGNRVSEFRESLQGKLEERLPFFSITLPNWFKTRYPHSFNSLEHNTNVLTSHFDVYHTMMDILGLYNISNTANVGQSLFRPIDNLTRSCASAGVDEHWCPCLIFSPISVKDRIVKKLAMEAVDFINQQIKLKPEAKRLCHTLELARVLKAGRREPSQRVKHFANTKRNEKCDSCGFEYNDKPSHTSSVTYELLLEVKPSNARFEVNVKDQDDKIIIDPQISRTNRYGTQPKCIEKKIPSLRKYCFCKS